jgi:hypothetical protein
VWRQQTLNADGDIGLPDDFEFDHNEELLLDNSEFTTCRIRLIEAQKIELVSSIGEYEGKPHQYLMMRAWNASKSSRPVLIIPPEDEPMPQANDAAADEVAADVATAGEAAAGEAAPPAAGEAAPPAAGAAAPPAAGAAAAPTLDEGEAADGGGDAGARRPRRSAIKEVDVLRRLVATQQGEIEKLADKLDRLSEQFRSSEEQMARMFRSVGEMGGLSERIESVEAKSAQVETLGQDLRLLQGQVDTLASEM